MVLGFIEYEFDYSTGQVISDMSRCTKVVSVGILDSDKKLMIRVWNELRKNGYSMSYETEYVNSDGNKLMSYMIYINLSKDIEIDREISPFQNDVVFSSYEVLVRNYKLSVILNA